MIALSPFDVETLTGRVVSENDITVAASMIDDQTGYTVDEHIEKRGVSEAQVKAAWAVVAVRVRLLLANVGGEAITSEVQGDYQYTEAVTLASSFRFSNITDGKPSELLNRDRARWAHI